jgi:GH15 family glucan-1,4-alpha-glucosidase
VDDVAGLPGGEGAFLTCSLWLIDALVGAGRVDDARRRFNRFLDLYNDVVLLVEEYETDADRQVGNTPQAFSHVGLVTSAQQFDAVTPDADSPASRWGGVAASGRNWPLWRPRH